MNFLTQLGIGANNADQGRLQAQEIQAKKMAIAQALAAQQGSSALGNAFASDDGAPPAPAALPGAAPLPWSGGGSPQAQATGLPNGGAPPVPGAGPSPVTGAHAVPTQGPSTPGGPPQMGAGMSSQGWSPQKVAMMVRKQNPNASGEAIMEAIKQNAGLMSQQSKLDFANFAAQAKLYGLELTKEKNEDTHEDRERGQDLGVQKVEMQQAGAGNRNANTVTGANARAAGMQEGENARSKDRLNSKTPTSVVEADADIKTAQSNLNNVRNNTPADQVAIAAAQKQLVDAQGAKRKLQSSVQSSVQATPSSSSERVTVKDKDGNVFTLPASQLDDALKQGYTKQ